MEAKELRTKDEKMKAMNSVILLFILHLLVGCSSLGEANRLYNARRELAIKGIDVSENSYKRLMESGSHDMQLLFRDAGIDSNSVAAYPSHLVWGAVEGDEEVVRVCLERGEQVDVKYNSYTPLMYASQRGYVDIVQLLIDYKADVNYELGYIQNESSKEWYPLATPLSLACSEGQIECVIKLLDNGAMLNDAYGSLALWTVLSAKHIKKKKRILLGELLLERGVDINAIFLPDTRVIDKACGCGDIETVEFLIDNGADITGWRGAYAISRAINAANNDNYYKIVKLLLKNVNCNAKYKNGEKVIKEVPVINKTQSKIKELLLGNGWLQLYQ